MSQTKRIKQSRLPIISDNKKAFITKHEKAKKNVLKHNDKIMPWQQQYQIYHSLVLLPDTRWRWLTFCCWSCCSLWCFHCGMLVVMRRMTCTHLLSMVWMSSRLGRITTLGIASTMSARISGTFSSSRFSSFAYLLDVCRRLLMASNESLVPENK